jgi:UDP-N-acetylmuramate: L-alanyl-gamma-D-glutamyl-meso-diaminopimelate ligase
VFPTFENYIDQFRFFLDTIEDGGTIIYNEQDSIVKQVVQDSAVSLNKIAYSTPESFTSEGVTFLSVSGKNVPLVVFGNHNLQNLEAARSVCNELGISDDNFYTSISSFKGASKRLELLAKNADTVIYKDFAHSPSKLRATINALKQQYPERQLVAVMELHTFSSLNKDFLDEYKGCMDEADAPIVFINRRTFEQKGLEPYDENRVKIAFNNVKLKFFNNSEILVEFLSYINYKGKNLLLMSSGDFGGINLNKLAEKATETQEV